MISFEFNDVQAMTQSAALKMAESIIRPLSKAQSAFRDVAYSKPLSSDFLNQLSSLGLVQSIATHDGGESASSRLVSSLVLEQFAWGDANSALAIAAPLGFVRAISEQGSARQRAELLPSFTADAYQAAAIAAAEPGLISSGLKSIKTEITRIDGGYVLNGRKALVPVAARCSHFLVIAREGAELRAIIVPARTPGVSIEPARYTMGCASSEMSDVLFKDVRVGSDALLGEEKGCDIQRLADGSWTAICAILTGVSKSAYEFIVEYVKERKVGGVVLGTKQAVAMKIVDMFADSESMRWMGWRAANQLDSGGAEATKYARLAYGRAVDTAGWIVDECLQYMGGHGLMAEYPMESWFRNTKTLSTLETAIGV